MNTPRRLTTRQILTMPDEDFESLGLFAPTPSCMRCGFPTAVFWGYCRDCARFTTGRPPEPPPWYEEEEE